MNDVSSLKVGSGTGERDGTLVLSNIRYEDGTPPVKVDQFLGITFKSPAAVDAKPARIITSPWSSVTPQVTNQSDGAQHLISAKFNFW